MLRHYLLVSLRNFRRIKLFSLINLIGLTLGICSSWLMLVYIYDELSYDRHFEDHERIVRLTIRAQFAESEIETPMVPPALGPAVVSQYSEAAKVAAVQKLRGHSLEHKNRKYSQQSMFYGTKDLFQVLSVPLLIGNDSLVLSEPNQIVLSAGTARQVFGEEDPVGELITIAETSFKVSGVFKDFPEQSHFHPNLFISVSSDSDYENYESFWRENIFYTYVLLKEGADRLVLQKNLDAINAEHVQAVFDRQNATTSLSYQPLTDIHLRSDLDFELEANSDILYVYIFAALAAFMMLIVCINYMNLSTAQASERTKEVGVRKALGALRTHLTRQFLAEAALLTLLAVLISALAFALILPWFNEIAGKNIGLTDMLQPKVLAGLLLSMIVVALLSGTYPSFFLSRIHPLQAFGRSSASSPSGLLLRKGLVILQFAVAIFTLVSTLAVYQQFSYMMNASLGFEDEQVLRIRLIRGESLPHAHALASEISQLADVSYVSLSNQSPGDEVKRDYFAFETDDGESTQLTQYMMADEHFVDVLDITLVSGRNLSHKPEESAEREKLEGREVLVNESLVKQLGWTIENAIGRSMKILPMGDDWRATVVGVYKDFHFSSLHDEVQPLIMVNFSLADEVLLVKLNSSDLASTLTLINDIYREQIGNADMDYSFLDEHFAAQYEADSKRTQLFTIFTLLTTLIACLGLLGLASFSASRRTKEIGIRKVLGASVPRLLYLLSKDFLKLVLFSLVVAIPLANYFLTDWLESFAYRIDLGWWLFIYPAAAVLLIALMTVSGLTLRAARRNPVETLRYE